MNMQILRYQSFSQDNPDEDMNTSIHNVTSGGVRIILVAATGDSQASLMVRAAELGYLSDEYVWLLNGDYTTNLMNAVNQHNAADTNSTTRIDFNSTFNGLFIFDNWLNLYGYPPFETFLDAWSQLNPAA